ncbi:MAG: PAS domain S-box protein [Phycisphaerales bacterium JB039]
MHASEVGSRGGPWAADFAGAAALGAAFDGLSVLVAVLDHDGRVLRLNEAARNLSPPGAASPVGEYLCRAPWWAADADRAAVHESVHSAAQRKVTERRQVRIRQPGLGKRTLELTVRPLPDLPCCATLLLADAVDVTDRTESTTALLSAQAQQQAVLDCLLDPLLIANGDGVILSASRAVESVLGYEPQELVGENVSALMPEPYRSAHHLYLEGHLRTGRTTILGRKREFEAVRKDGRVIPIELSVARADLPHQGSPVFVGLLRDLTEDRRARAEVLERDRRLRRMLEASQLLAVMLDVEGRVTFCNDAALELTGWDLPEALGTDWFEHFLPREEQAALRQRFQEACATGEIATPVEAHLVTRSGGQRLIQWNNSALEGPDGQLIGVTSIGMDITDQRQAEAELRAHRQRLAELVRERTAELEESHEQLRIADRLASLGTLTAGLGHDMSNILLPTMCRLDVVEAETSDVRVREEVRQIRHSLEHLRKLGDGLRLLSSDPNDELASDARLDLNAWWEEIEPLIARAVPRNVTLTVMIQPGLAPIGAPAHRLTQAAMNLVVNAADAVRAGGHIWMTATILPGGAEVEIAVRDDGVGMPAHVLRRCLDPFFTTKKRGLGTGLGLTLAHAVARSAGGRLEIESAPGAGTTVRMIIPALGSAEQVEPVVASVSIAHPRTAAFVRSLLAEAASLAPSTGGAPDETAQLWVADDTPAARAEARRFLGADGRRRVVLIGKGRGGRLAHLRTVPTVTDIEQLRQALAESIAEATGGSDDHAQRDSHSVC